MPSDSPFIGTIEPWPCDFEPSGWKYCHGQILNINEYSALYSLLGKKYGGDGEKTFALPDLRGRFPIGVGSGTGLTSKILADKGGDEKVTLKISEMPFHSHTISIDPNASAKGSIAPPAKTGNMANVNTPQNNYPAGSGSANIYSSTKNSTLAPFEVELKLNIGSLNAAPVGGNEPHNNLPPYLCLNYIICVNGLFPERS